MVVIMAFLSRFKLDQDMSDLGERINGKKNVLEVQAPIEAKFRTVQDKINLAKETKNEGIKTSEIFSALEADVPAGVKLKNLNVEKNMVTFTAVALSENELVEFLQRGSRNDKWREVELVNVSAGTQIGVNFSMKLWL